MICNKRGSATASSLQWRDVALFFAPYFALFNRDTNNGHIDSHSLKQNLFIFNYNRFCIQVINVFCSNFWHQR